MNSEQPKIKVLFNKHIVFPRPLLESQGEGIWTNPSS